MMILGMIYVLGLAASFGVLGALYARKDIDNGDDVVILFAIFWPLTLFVTTVAALPFFLGQRYVKKRVKKDS